MDEAGIRSNVASQLQSEIDATSQVYAEKLRQAELAGAGKLGSNAAVSARRGLLGSDFGDAANANTVADNNATYAGIDAEKAAAISSITDKGNALAQQEIDAKNTAKQSGASDYINFLTTQGTRQTARTTDAAQRALSAGIDLTTASPDDINAIASSYNISPTALVSAFTSARKASSALTSVPVTDSSYQLNPATGKYEQVQQGSATPDSALKEYQYAVQNNGFTGSLADWNAGKANQKVSVGVKTNPLTGTQTEYDRTGPAVAGTATPSKVGGNIPGAAPTAPVTLPTGSSSTQTAPATPYATAPLPNPANKVQLSYLKGFTNGPAQKQSSALNTAVGHLFDANSIFSTVNNGQFPDANAVANYLKTAAGAAAAKNYSQAAGLVGSEIAGAYGADTQSERADQAAAGSSIDSPAQHQGFVSTTATLLSSKLSSNIQDWTNAMGSPPDSYDHFISPANQVKLAAMGVDVAHLVPGVTTSKFTQSLIDNAHVDPKTGDVYIPVDPSNPQGAYQKLQ